jgi:hypothetical protein
MNLLEENYKLLKHLKGKTIRAHDFRYGWTTLFTVKSMGMKRVHIDVIGIATYYLTFKQFLDMVWMGYDIIDEPEIAKYYLSGSLKKVLDV